MIRVFCDICGDLIGSHSYKDSLPDDGGGSVSSIDGASHKCERCEKILNEISVPTLVQQRILEIRKEQL